MHKVRIANKLSGFCSHKKPNQKSTSREQCINYLKLCLQRACQ
jgi:hypothetical protein